jgi:hypothetical protein
MRYELWNTYPKGLPLNFAHTKKLCKSIGTLSDFLKLRAFKTLSFGFMVCFLIFLQHYQTCNKGKIITNFEYPSFFVPAFLVFLQATQSINNH